MGDRITHGHLLAEARAHLSFTLSLERNEFWWITIIAGLLALPGPIMLYLAFQGHGWLVPGIVILVLVVLLYWLLTKPLRHQIAAIKRLMLRVDLAYPLAAQAPQVAEVLSKYGEVQLEWRVRAGELAADHRWSSFGFDFNPGLIALPWWLEDRKQSAWQAHRSAREWSRDHQIWKKRMRENGSA